MFHKYKQAENSLQNSALRNSEVNENLSKNDTTYDDKLTVYKAVIIQRERERERERERALRYRCRENSQNGTSGSMTRASLSMRRDEVMAVTVMLSSVTETRRLL